MSCSQSSCHLDTVSLQVNSSTNSGHFEAPDNFIEQRVRNNDSKVNAVDLFASDLPPLNLAL